MAEVKSADPTRTAEGGSRVVPFGAPRREPARAESERNGVSWSAFGIAVALIAFAAAALIVQTHRVGTLTDRASRLEAQLDAANAQLATYHAQLGLIRTSVAAVADQVANLSTLVEADPGATPANPAEPNDSPDAR
jgi:hypothetical protein